MINSRELEELFNNNHITKKQYDILTIIHHYDEGWIDEKNLENKLSELFNKDNELLNLINIDLKKYIIDTDDYGIDKDTLKSRAERYRKELT